MGQEARNGLGWTSPENGHQYETTEYCTTRVTDADQQSAHNQSKFTASNMIHSSADVGDGERT